MSTDHWARLSSWHNAWLAADPAERERLRRSLAADSPDLAVDAEDLIAGSDALAGFLETPAFVLAASDLAADAAPPLTAGATLGPYRIVGLIARGGMGDVYRATDVRLQRDVALKLMAHTGEADTARVDRFVQEARVMASLDHPHIVRIYDVGLSGDRPYLVAELLDGETLRERLARGAVPPGEARRIAIEVARGLGAAHAHGLVHRDLKPENVFLTGAGVTKILDFGIAKLSRAEAVPDGLATMPGVVLGTAGYLAPEQILGSAVDRRADLFALGAILFEMLAGRRAFARARTIDALYAILHDAAPRLAELQPGVSPSLAAIVDRLLEKSPDQRFQSAADVAWALEHADEPAPAARSAHVPEAGAAAGWRSPRVWLPAAAMVVVAFALFGFRDRIGRGGAVSRVAPPARLAQFAWTLPDGVGLTSAPVVSPDGQRIAFAGADAAGSRVYIRDLGSLDARAIAGTEHARHPFWSPDGASLGFFAGGKLKRIAIDAGTPVVLADAPDARGGAWGSSGVIVFLPIYRDSGLKRVPAAGGPVEDATLLDPSGDEIAHRWPAFLPDGVRFVYQVVSLDERRSGVYLGTLAEPAAPPQRLLAATDSNAVYATVPGSSEGVLLTASGGRVQAIPFDPVRARPTGDARSLPLAAVSAHPHNPAMVDAAGGVLAFSTEPVPVGVHFASVGTDGTGLAVAPLRELTGWPRVSPDGRLLARTRVTFPPGDADVWVEDLERGTSARVTTSRAFDVMPVWSPDGRRLAYRSGPLHQPRIDISAADGAGAVQTLACPNGFCEPTDWSRDGRYLLLNVRGDVWRLPVDPRDTPQPVLAQPFDERDARLSFDGAWMAYVSDESGAPEVYVRSVEGPSQRFVVSSGGGDQPVWSADGRWLYYATPAGRLYRVAVTATTGGLRFGAAGALPVPGLGARHWGTIYEVTPDGRRLFFPHPGDEQPPREFRVVLDWMELLR